MVAGMGSEALCDEDGDICAQAGREVVFCDEGGEVCDHVVQVEPLDGGTLLWSFGVLKTSFRIAFLGVT
jgi:hypothetical protein